MSNNKRLLRVFLCYCHEDESSVRVLYQWLQQINGVDVWFDREKLLPGQDWEREISNAVSKSDLAIVCHSKLFKRQGYQHKEVTLALEAAKSLPGGEIFIIPAKLEECEVLDDLRRWQWVDLFDRYDPARLPEKVCIRTAEHGFADLMRALRLRAHTIDVILRPKKSNDAVKKTSGRSRRSTSIKARTRAGAVDEPLTSPHALTEYPVPKNVISGWLIRHGLIVNPFGHFDMRTEPFYPSGAVRPDQWQFLLDTVSLVAYCPTPVDARALAQLLLNECLPWTPAGSYGSIERLTFPIWVWFGDEVPVPAPLFGLARSAARAWLEILFKEPDTFLALPEVDQADLLEMLCWCLRSKAILANMLQLSSLPGNGNTQTLLGRIDQFKPRFVAPAAPNDSVLISWLKIRPLGMNQTTLIIPGDVMSFPLPLSWYEQFNALITEVSSSDIVAKLFTSSSSWPVPLALQEIELSWSDEWLKRSLENQFNDALHSEEKYIGGKWIRFHELFGPGSIESDTTDRLIAAARNSLARLLMLGNRLIQFHCRTNESETYLSLEELEDILKAP